MLWVTITTVMSLLISRMVSSILRVEPGSSAEHGSSINKTFGLTANDLAIQSLCCCPPDKDDAEASKRSFTSFHKLALSKQVLTISSGFSYFICASFNPDKTLSLILMVGKGFGF